MKRKLRHQSTGLHRCGYPRCETVITTARFLCLIHWQQLSGELRVRLNGAFRSYLAFQDEDSLLRLRQVQGQCLQYLLDWDCSHGEVIS